jgi:flagellar hook-associated protein 3
MRISTAYPQQFNVNSMFDQQAKLNETQLKLSSGKKYLTPAENPSAAAYALGFQQSINETLQYQENADAVTQRLTLEETSLSSAIDTLQRLKELGLQGVSDSGNSTISRNAIAAEFEQLNEHLVGLANTRNANGEYIFSGTNTTEMPFGKKTDISSKLDVVVLATTESKTTATEALPVKAWDKFVTTQATSAAYDFILKNPVNIPVGTKPADAANLRDLAAQAAAEWVATQDTTPYVDEAKLNASLNHKAFPATWDASWNDTNVKFVTEFNKAIVSIQSKNAPVASLKQLADAATVSLNDAKVAYKTSVANYVDPASTVQTISTPKSEAWTDYVSKQAVSDAYQLVDQYNPSLTLEDAIKKSADRLEAYTNAVNSPAGVSAGRSGTLAFKIAAEQTASVYNTAFQAIFTQANDAKNLTDSAVAGSEFQVALTENKDAATSAWTTYSTASDRTINVSATAANAITTTDVVTPTTTTSKSAFFYSGSNTQREIQIGVSRKIADGDTGSNVFGPSHITGKMIFDTVKNFADELRADRPTLATLQELDDAFVQLSTVRSTIGARINAIDRQKQSNEDFIINTKTALSQVQDLDYAQAITQLNSQQMSLQAAQQSYSKVQGMSLFKYI